MAFDLEGALKEGYSYSEIADHLSSQSDFDLDGARKEGYSDEDIVNHLSGKEFKQQESVNVESTDEDQSISSKAKQLVFGDYTPAESVKRQLGLTARSAIQGVTALPDIAAAGVRGGLNLLLPEKYEIPERYIGQDIVNALDLPQPETSTEKVVGRAAEFMAGTGSGSVAKYLKPQTTTGKAIQESLVENMPTQLASGAAGGAASAIAEEKGAGVLGQTTSALGAGIVPFLFSKGKPQSSIVTKQANDKSISKSKELLNKYEIEAAEAINRGVPREEVNSFVIQRMGINQRQIDQALVNTEKQLPIPKTKIEADSIAVANRMAKLKERGEVKEFFTNIIQPVETRLQEFFPSIFNRVRNYSIQENTLNEQYIGTVKPFMSAIKSLPEDVYKKLTLDLYNGNFSAARKTMVDNLGEAQARQFDVTTNLLKKLYKDLGEVGFDIGQIQNYFPRGNVKDLDGLYAHLEANYGYKAKDNIQKQFEKKALDLRTSIDDLPEEETAKILNNYLKGYSRKGGPSFTKERQIQELTEDLLPFFNDPVDSLDNYIRSVVSSIEEARFFGKNNLKATGRIIDTKSSVGNLLAREFSKGKNQINVDYLDEAEALLNARFNAGKRSPSKIMQMARDLTYMATLGNPLAAATQLADVALSVSAHGLKNTMANAFKASKLTMEKLGLEDAAAELKNNVVATSKYLDKILGSRFVGFKQVDRFGKNRNINASINKAKKLLSTKSGEGQLKAKYKGFFGDRFDQFAADLKRDVFSPDVKAYALMELGDVQPIFLESLPAFYLNHPNGRLFYALQSFTLKQLDYMNRNIRKVWQAGNKKEAAKQALVYYSLIAGANTGTDVLKDLMLFRPVDPERLPVDAFFNVFKTFGLSQYALERYGKQADIEGLAKDLFLDPASFSLFTPIKDVKNIIEGDAKKIQSLRMIPWVGPFLYEFFGGGRESYLKRTQ